MGKSTVGKVVAPLAVKTPIMPKIKSQKQGPMIQGRQPRPNPYGNPFGKMK